MKKYLIGTVLLVVFLVVVCPIVDTLVIEASDFLNVNSIFGR